MENVISIFDRSPVHAPTASGEKRTPVNGWRKLPGVFKRHFLCRAHADSDFQELEWHQLPGNIRAKLHELIRDNPRCGPDLGLVPKGGVYSTGESYFEAVQRKTKEGTWV